MPLSGSICFWSDRTQNEAEENMVQNVKSEPLRDFYSGTRNSEITY